MELSGRGKLPGLYKMIPLETALDYVQKNNFLVIAFHVSSGEEKIKKFDPKMVKDAESKMTTVFIGPEGGWTDGEILDAVSHGTNQVASDAIFNAFGVQSDL